MALHCSFLNKQSPLTDTTNRLLEEAESSCKRKYFSGVLEQKQPLTTSFSLRNRLLTDDKSTIKGKRKKEREREICIQADSDVDMLEDLEEVVTLRRKKCKKLIHSELDVERAYSRGAMLSELDDRSEMLGMGVSAFEQATYSAAPTCRAFGSVFKAVPQAAMLQAQQSFCFGGSPGYGANAPQISHVLNYMPAYNFPSLPFKQSTEPDYKFLEEDSMLLFKKKHTEGKRIKMRLLNAVSTSLLFSPHFKAANDPFRIYLLKCAEDVLSFDPEFILKVALYARQELNIRSTANFLLAFSANENSCRPFLKKYFEESICLPTDWIDVAEMYLVFNPNMQPRSLPAALRKVMKTSFTKFDTYQLAKYNKKGKKSKKHKKATEQEDDASDTEVEETKKKSYSLKQLIRLLHITSPVEEVMCILGKKYPSDPDSFRQHGLPGTWNSANAGKRMKLPIPETWETTVSAKGNKAEVWETLIDNAKLPYMATLRNLRNLIMAGISNDHHAKVQARLSKKTAVIKSRQFPLRFFAAFKVLQDLESLYYNPDQKSLEVSPKDPVWRKQQKKVLLQKVEGINISVLEKYKESLSQALEISANHNLDPIGGRTLVICDLVDDFAVASEGGADRFLTKFNSCIFLPLMCLKACEECEVKAILITNTTESIELKSKLFLENMSELCEKYSEFRGMDWSEDVLTDPQSILCEQLQGLFDHYLKTQTFRHQKFDNVIFLKSSDSSGDDRAATLISNFLHKYRHLVNPDLLYIQVDLSVDTGRFEDLPPSSDENNVYLAGFSEQIFKFIAERSNGGQLAHVENIDEKYALTKKMKVTHSEDSVKSNLLSFGQKIPIYSGVPKWKTARIFVSSTFKDMHGERDLLLRYVFPELKARAASIFVKVNEIDLRWGISEEDSMSNNSHRLCLLEAQNCDFFIGMLGERYGTRCSFDGDGDPSFSWLKLHNQSSVTELEMHCGALNRKSAREKAFFYFRNSEFIRNVPSQWKELFESEDEDSERRLTALKDKIRRSGMEVFDSYPCHFAGLYEENPVVAGLDSFGQRVLDNLWNAISRFYKKEDDSSEMSEEETCHQMVTDSFDYFVGEQNSPLNWIMKELKNRSGIFVVTGKPGCGKTAFIAKVLKEIRTGLVIPYFIGTSSQSTNLGYMLSYIGNSVLSKLPLDIPVPDTKESLLNNFHDIIIEGAKSVFPGTLLLVIDGLDYLDVEAQKLDWLPYDLPNGFKLICSTSDSSEAFTVLSKREKIGCSVCFVQVKPLVVADRQELVRHSLKQHGKTLDESPFNNQMLQLVTKQDSGNPLYLQVACDYLKTFAVFENLMQKLQTFPSVLNQVLEEIIYQMEKYHGTTIVQHALSIMCISREGLDDNEMHILLSVVTKYEVLKKSPLLSELVEKITRLKPEHMLPPVNFFSLVHMLKTFAYPFGTLSHSRLRLASKKFASVITKYYAKNEYVKKASYHKLLAAHYLTVCCPEHKENRSRPSTSAICDLLYHLLHGNQHTKLAYLLCDQSFLQVAFTSSAGEELPEYYGALMDGDVIKSIPFSREKIQEYGNFVFHNMHILKSWPFLIYQQALNEPVDSSVYKERGTRKGITLECVSRSSEMLGNRPKILDGFVKNIVCVKIHDVDPIAALGSEDGSAKVLNIATGKVLSSLRGHSSTITSICFLGKDRICLSSADNTLSIWSYSEQYRIAVLEGHTRFISSCCCDPQGNLVSAGWDCTVRFWSSQDGRPVSCISNIKSPVNSVAHHPSQQLLACGLWNKTIEIWDTLLLTKKTTLRGHSGSVQSVVYSADGVHVLSSSLCGEVFIWSANECLKIAKMDGHASSVNSISCSSRRSYIVTASDDTTLKVWPDEQQAVRMTIEKFKTHPVHFMEIVSQLHLAVAFQNSIVRVFDLLDGHVVAELDTTSDQVSCFSKFNGKEDRQSSQCIDRSVEVLIFGTKSGKAMELKFESASVTEVGCLNSRMTVMLHTQCIAFCGTTNGDLALLSFDNKIPHGIIYAAHENSITALSVSSSGMLGHVLSASADKTVKMWDFGESNGKEDLTPKLTTDYPSKHKDYVTSCCIYQRSTSSKGKTVMLTGSYDNTVVIWDDEKEQVLTGLKTSVSGIYFSGKYVIACGSEGSIVVWTQKGKCISSIPGIEKSSAVIAFDFQIDKTSVTDFDATLAFVENDGSISIRKPFQRSPICTLQGHGHRVTSCDINRNDVILSCSLDKTVNIWKVLKSTTQDTKVFHSGRINSVAISHSENLSFSGDEHGNLILWHISHEQSKHTMKYITQKKYAGGSVTAVLWMKDDKAICAAKTQSKEEEKHFIEILNCKPSSELDTSFIIQVQHQRYFSSEITSVDYLLSTDSVAVGLKSGHLFLMNSHMQKEIEVENDWILKAVMSPTENPVLYEATPDGLIKCFSFSALCNNQLEPKETIDLCGSDKPWITALNCDSKGMLCTGDTSGKITTHISNRTTTKQAHTASVSDICILGDFLFTCSLDRTVKVWNLASLEQVGQFHTQSPISSLAVPGGKWNQGAPKSFSLIFGTVVGDVHLLRLEWSNQHVPSNITEIFGGQKVVNNATTFSFGSPKSVESATVFGGQCLQKAAPLITAAPLIRAAPLITAAPLIRGASPIRAAPLIRAATLDYSNKLFSV